MTASKLDAELPSSSLKLWFNRLVGPKASVVWQLTECGDDRAGSDAAEQDVPACVQANAVLPDGRQVTIAISVGTFNNGITGDPAFYSVVVERDGRLSWINRLHNLPNLLYSPKNPSVRLPELTARSLEVRPYSESASFSIGPDPLPERLLALGSPPSKPEPLLETSRAAMPEISPLLLETSQAAMPEISPLLMERQRPQRIQEGVLQGRAMVMVKPDYPVHAKSLNTSGSVAVQVVVSEEGRVVDARAVSGPLVLREPSVQAARKWVFKPTTFNNQPVRVESVLTFVYSRGSN